MGNQPPLSDIAIITDLFNRETLLVRYESRTYWVNGKPLIGWRVADIGALFLHAGTFPEGESGIIGTAWVGPQTLPDGRFWQGGARSASGILVACDRQDCREATVQTIGRLLTAAERHHAENSD
jgi:hypothetical protein